MEELDLVFTTVGNVAVSKAAQYGSDASEPLESRCEKSSLSKMTWSIELDLEKSGFGGSVIELVGTLRLGDDFAKEQGL